MLAAMYILNRVEGRRDFLPLSQYYTPFTLLCFQGFSSFRLLTLFVLLERCQLVELVAAGI